MDPNTWLGQDATTKTLNSVTLVDFRRYLCSIEGAQKPRIWPRRFHRTSPRSCTLELTRSYIAEDPYRQTCPARVFDTLKKMDIGRKGYAHQDGADRLYRHSQTTCFVVVFYPHLLCCWSYYFTTTLITLEGARKKLIKAIADEEGDEWENTHRDSLYECKAGTTKSI